MLSYRVHYAATYSFSMNGLCRWQLLLLKLTADCRSFASLLAVPSIIASGTLIVSDLIFSRPRSEGWPHHGRTFSIYPCPLSFWLTLPWRVLATSWCCPPRPCMVFLAYEHLALFLALSLSPGNSLVSSLCDHSMLASLLWRWINAHMQITMITNQCSKIV